MIRQLKSSVEGSDTAMRPDPVLALPDAHSVLPLVSTHPELFPLLEAHPVPHLIAASIPASAAVPVAPPPRACVQASIPGRSSRQPHNPSMFHCIPVTRTHL